MPLPLTARREAPLRALSSRCAARCASLRPPGDRASAPPTIPAKGARAEGALPRSTEEVRDGWVRGHQPLAADGPYGAGRRGPGVERPQAVAPASGGPRGGAGGDCALLHGGRL